MLSPKTALALLLLTSMVSAGDFHGRHAMAGKALAAHAGLAIRQEDNTPESGSPPAAQQTSSAPPPETSAPPAPTTSAPPPSATSDGPKPDPETSTPPPPETSAEPTPDPTSPPPTTSPTPEPSSKPSETPTPTSETPEEQSTTTRKETSEAPIQTTSAPKPSSSSSKAQPTTLFSTQEYTTIIVTRNPAGVDETATRTQKSLVPTATAEPIDSAPKTESGMSQQTKTTVIGVVCGVGGAILLAGIFFVWWKWSSRRKQRAAIDDGDELVGMNAFQPSGMGSTSEKHHGGGGSGMTGGGQGGLFKDNLESYHAPTSQRPANAGTNF